MLAGAASGPLGVAETRALLQGCDIPLVDDVVATTPTAAGKAANAMGYPVVMKVASPDIPHKSDAGLVKLGVASTGEARATYSRLMAKAKEAFPAARIEGVQVQRQIGGGIETIVGLSRDPVFGSVVLVGAGGVFAEVLEDVAVRPVPIDRRDAEDMVASLRSAALLDGARGRPKADTKALVDVILAVARWAPAAATWWPSSTSIRWSCCPRAKARWPSTPSSWSAPAGRTEGTMELALTDDQVELQAAVRAMLDREKPVELSPGDRVPTASAARPTWQGGRRAVGPHGRARLAGAHDPRGRRGRGARHAQADARHRGARSRPGARPVAGDRHAVRADGGGGGQRRATRPLPRRRSRRRAGALAIAEGDDWAPVGATAMSLLDGESWALDGAKHWVLGADVAAELAVVARERQSGAVVVAVVAADTDGVTVTPTDSLDASRGMATVTFEAVVVPPDRVLSAGDADARPVLARALEQATVALVAEIVGVCQGILDIVLAHVGSREQFGVKIGSFQAVKHKLANMYVAVESARALTRFAAAAIDEDDGRRALAASMAKASAGDCQRLLAVEGIQCLGGIGYTWEHDMHLYVKRAKTDAAMFGTSAEHRAQVAGRIGL